MKNTLNLFVAAALTTAVLAFAAQPVCAQSGGDTGIGVTLGTPTGLSLKHWLSQDDALQAAIAWDLGASGAGLFVDYVHAFHRFHPGRSVVVPSTPALVASSYGTTTTITTDTTNTAATATRTMTTTGAARSARGFPWESGRTSPRRPWT